MNFWLWLLLMCAAVFALIAVVAMIERKKGDE